MNNKIVVGLLVLLVGVGAGWYFLQGGGAAPEMKQDARFTETTPAAEPTVTLGSEGSATGATGAAVEKGGVPSSGSIIGKTAVSYGTGGFVPNTVTVKIGTVVLWTNQSQGGMWVASAMHPTHQLLPGFDQLASVNASGSYEYTFAKVGTWKYHMHLNPSDTGTVVVTE